MWFYGRCFIFCHLPLRKNTQKKPYTHMHTYSIELNRILFEWLQGSASSNTQTKKIEILDRKWLLYLTFTHKDSKMCSNANPHTHTLCATVILLCAVLPLFWAIKFWLNTFIFINIIIESWACRQWKQIEFTLTLWIAHRRERESGIKMLDC